ncbi:MAG: hypothetical protein GF383_16745 [Candidatus Lokiarchaeota archaeon]|nr:hypothetical protein [Candidatus Lokiarchaeota archaeon]
MDLSNSPIEKTEQMQKIMDDTEEIIRNFREISETMAERINQGEDSMLNLGRKIVHDRTDSSDPGTNPGDSRVNML